MNLPDLVVIGASATSVCVPSPTITLSADQTGSTSNYVFTWSVNPSGTAGLSGTTGDTVYITPTVAGNYTVTLSAVDAGASCALIVEQIITVSNVPSIATISASPSTVCSGAAVNLSATSLALQSDTVRVGTGTTGSTTTYMPFYRSVEGHKGQYLFKASELTALGLAAGNITEVSLRVMAAVVSPDNLNGFTIRMAQTSDAVVTTTWVTSGLSTVYGPVNYSPTFGVNTFPVTAFTWNGTSNIIIQTCFDNDPNNTCTTCTGNIPSVQYTSASGFVSSHYWYASNTAQSNRSMCDTLYTGFTSSSRPNWGFRGQKATNVTSSFNWVWNPGAVSGSSVTVNPTSTTTYTVTASAGVCSDDTTVTVNVNPLPATPTANNSSQCGYGTPTCSVSGGAGPFTWTSVTNYTATATNSVNITLSNPATDEGTVCPGGNLMGSFTLPPITGTVIGAHLTINGITLNGGSYGSEVTLNLTGSGITGTSPCFTGATSTSTPSPFNWVTGSGSVGAGDTATLAALLNTAGGTININYSESFNDDALNPDATFPTTATLQYFYQYAAVGQVVLAGPDGRYPC